MYSSTTAITLHAPVSYLSYQWQCAELNRQFPFGIDLNKISPDLLKLKTKAEELDMEISQHLKVKGSKAQAGSKLNYALD